MSAIKLDDKALDDSRELSFSSAVEDNSQTSTSSIIRVSASSVFEHKVNFIAKTFHVYYITL